MSTSHVLNALSHNGNSLNYNISWCGSLWVHSIWKSLGFLNLDLCFLPHIREVLGHYCLFVFCCCFGLVWFGCGFFGHVYGMHMFPGQGLNLSHSSDNVKSLITRSPANSQTIISSNVIHPFLPFSSFFDPYSVNVVLLDVVP